MEDGLDEKEDDLDGKEDADDSRRLDEKQSSGAGQAELDYDNMMELDDNMAEKGDGIDEMADGSKIG